MIFKHKKEKIAVGLSGGVDSSVAALLLARNPHYEVVGVYMRNWSEELPEIRGCPWEEDQRYARLVAAKIGIPFYVLNFEEEYYDQVVQYMIAAYRQGLTPNPDIMCNQEIKFGIFLEKMLGLGFDKIATGHYARIERQEGAFRLLAGSDPNKDQSYFLCRLKQDQLARAVFPIGSLLKTEVRTLAREAGLPSATKKDSQGICFIGNIKVRDFLKRYISGTAGKIVDQSGKALGECSGLEFYTIGQRAGLDIGGGGPYYVVTRDFTKKILMVTDDPDDPSLYQKECEVVNLSWTDQSPALSWSGGIRIRYRHPIMAGRLLCRGEKYIVEFAEKQKAVTPGQSAAFYQGDVLLGSGIIK